MQNVYENGKWIAKGLDELGRKDWNHNSEGQVDYLPLYGMSHVTSNSTPIPLEEQKYDYERQEHYENGAYNLSRMHERKPDWVEYERIQRDYN